MRKQISFRLRRIVLMSIWGLAIVLPFIQIDLLSISTVAQFGDPFIYTGFNEFYEVELNSLLVLESNNYNFWIIFWKYLSGLYLLGALVLAIRFLFRVLVFYFIIYNNEVIKKDGYKYVILQDKGLAFTFLNYIFVSKAIWLSDDCLLIAKHEKIHVRHQHSIDRLLTEILCVFQWINPFIYWFRKELVAVHEYQVDKVVVDSGIDAISYQQLIIKYACPSIQFSFGNHFNQSLTLNRIKMIAQNKSFSKLSAYRILFLLPVFALLFCCFAFQSGPINESVLLEDNDSFILPITEGQFKKASGFGMRTHPVSKIQKLHTGIDLVAPEGTSLLAVKNAVVVRVQQSDEGYGNNVVLAVDETISVLYGHMQSIGVKVGQELKQGDIIGTVGNTGKSVKPHLHFELIQNGKKVDPKAFLPKF
ncbi:MAG: peptidoglycan DD-metalloendopeptidase family protein [Aureispira sp.]|nr:peptidoglycan DD-metalloendopeptidase family protein [Aureispira sp.]